MKKGRLFGKLYSEALRQTRVVGIIFTVIMSIAAFAVPFGIYLDESVYVNRHGYDLTASIIDFSEINILFPVLTYVLAPLMVFMSFSFLNKRASSDFYHSATQTRPTVFFAYSLSVLTWIMIAAGASIIAGLIVPFACPDYFIINWYTFIEIPRRLISSVYVVSAATLAMTLTGTLINNILVTGIIIFAPRLMMLIIGSSVVSYVSVLPGIEYLGILNPNYNLVFNDLTQLFGAYSTINHWGMLYTGILAAVYFILAYIGFKLRPSETAGQSAPNRLLQNCYRILITMVVCSVGCIGIFAWMTGNVYEEAEMMLFELALLYIGALIVWFVYELITTRKASNLLKTIPSLGIVLVLNVAIVVLMTGINEGVERFRPEPDEIEYVRIDSDNKNYYGEITYSLAEYLTGDASKIKITDPEVKKIVSDGLINTLDDSYSDYQEIYRETVIIGTKQGEKYRDIYIPYTDYEFMHYTLNSIMAENKSFNKLPEFNSSNMSTYSYYDLTKDEIELLYDSLVNEIEIMDNEELANTVAMLDNSAKFGGFEIYTYKGFDRVNIYIEFSALLEKTASKYLELCSNDPEDEMLFKKFDDAECEYHYIDMNVMDPTSYGYSHNWNGTYEDLEKMGLIDDLAKNYGKKIDTSKPFIEINYGYSYSKEGEYVEYEDATLFISLDGIELPEEFIKYGEEEY